MSNLVGPDGRPMAGASDVNAALPPVGTLFCPTCPTVTPLLPVGDGVQAMMCKNGHFVTVVPPTTPVESVMPELIRQLTHALLVTRARATLTEDIVKQRTAMLEHLARTAAHLTQGVRFAANEGAMDVDDDDVSHLLEAAQDVEDALKATDLKTDPLDWHAETRPAQ